MWTACTTGARAISARVSRAGTCGARTRSSTSVGAASTVGGSGASVAGSTAITRSSISRVAGRPHSRGPIGVRVIGIALVRAPAIAAGTTSRLTLASVPGCTAVLGSLRVSGGSGSLCLSSARRSATGSSAGCAARLSRCRYTRHYTRCRKYHERSFDRQVRLPPSRLAQQTDLNTKSISASTPTYRAT